jgi:hypothetical protein
VKILGDGTQNFTIAMTNKLQDELGVIAASFAPIGAVAKGGTVGVATGIALIMEEETSRMLLLVLLIFLL